MKKLLKDICTQIRGVSYKPTDIRSESDGIPILRANNIQDDGIGLDDLVYVDAKKVHDEQYLQNGDIVICASSGSKNLVGKAATYNKNIKASFGAFCKTVRVNKSNDICLEFIQQFFQSKVYRNAISELSIGANINNIKTEHIDELEINLPPIPEQEQIAATLDKLQSAINNKKQQLTLLDEAVKSEFVELFGDFSEASNIQWEMKQFTEVAKIDGNMVNDFSKYADYPHIGIDSIEKNTGELKGYRTVKEDNVISGKYLFTSEHIIYSKIRPNLNKVALPTFHGVCSADAYPILVDKTKCNRYYLAYLMRSDYFLTYILAFASRAGMPKVNREQVNGFKLPVPPLDLQNQFAAFVQEIDKSKFVVKQQIADLQELLDSKMQEYFS